MKEGLNVAAIEPAIQPADNTPVSGYQFAVEKVKSMNDSDPETFSWTAMAKAVGISLGYFTQWRDNKIAGITDERFSAITHKVLDYLNLQERRLTGPRKFGFVETENARHVLNMCEFARTMGCMAMLTSAAGHGKSISLKKYTARTEKVFYFYVNTTMSPLLLKEIAKAVGVSIDGSQAIIYNEVKKKLTGSNVQFIFDECQKLGYNGLELLRELYDECKISVVIAGDRSLEGRIRGDYANKRRSDYGFDQLYSRFRLFRELKPLTAEDFHLILSTLYDEVEMEEITWLHRQCSGNGRILENVCELFQYSGLKPSRSSFEKVAEFTPIRRAA